MLLAMGALVGLAVAAGGLLRTDPGMAGLPSSAVARVNASLITVREYERLVEGLEADTREPADEQARRRVLDRLIEEELLVQRGLALGLAENDRRVRADITQAMIRSVVVEVEDDVADRDSLREFYRQEIGFFTRPGRMHIRQIFIRVSGRRGANRAGEASRQGEATRLGDDEGRQRIEEAQRRLEAGAPFDAVAEELGDRPVSPVPDTMLPPAKVRDYLGPTVLHEAQALSPGEVSAPIRSGTGFHLVQMVDREEPSALPFEEVVPLVEREWRRRAGDRALRSYLDALREEADVMVADPLP